MEAEDRSTGILFKQEELKRERETSRYGFHYGLTTAISKGEFVGARMSIAFVNPSSSKKPKKSRLEDVTN